MDKYITIHLVIKENENEEDKIKRIFEEVLEEKAKQSMRYGFEMIPGIIQNPKTCEN